MSVKQLTDVVAPPPNPLERPSAERLAAAERTLGITFPDDYKDLVNTYGSGSFNDFMLVFIPYANNRYRNMLEVSKEIIDAYRTSHDTFPDQAPFPPFGEPGGLFPWARTDNGDVFYWKTEGDPNMWPTVLFESRHAFYEEFKQSPTELLAGLFGGSIESRSFPSPDDFGDDPFFESRA